MTPVKLPPTDVHPEPGWPADPRKHVMEGRKNRASIFLRLNRHITALGSLLNVSNFKKAIDHVQNGKYTIVFTAFRNLLFRNLSEAENKQIAEAPVEEIQCLPLALGQPLVSIVIPCFNYGDFVADAVESVLGQTLTNVEIIVVDGGSNDSRTLDVLDNLVRPRTRVLFRDGRHLVGDNRNFGIQHASGRYICCLDADDTLAPTYLEKAVFLLEMYGYDVASTAIRFMGERSGTVGILPLPDLKRMLRGNHVNTCAVFRRLLWEQSGGYFDVGLGHEHVAEDWDFWIRLAANGARIRNIADEALFNYRIHLKGSLSSNSDVKSISEQGKAIRERNRALLTAEAIHLSAVQQERRLRSRVAELNLTRSMAQATLEASRPTLMLAMPYLLIGGAERLLSQLTGYLVRHEWRVIVVTTINQDAQHGDATEWFSQHTPEIYALPRFLNTNEWQDFVEYLLISRRPDCLLTAGSEYFYQRLPDFLECNPDMAMVDLLFNTSAHVASHLERKAFYTMALAESDEVMQWYRSVGWEEGRICKLTSGIDLNSYQPRPKPEELLNRYGISPSDIVVGFSGRLSLEKAPDVFIEIARLCQDVPNVRFIMTGGGPAMDDIRKLAADLPSGVRLDFVGIVEEVTPYLALYDLLVLPSRLDGRPLVVLEALACGLPVIASRVGGLPELIEDDCNGYLCAPALAPEFAAHIRALAGDRQRIAKLKAGARAFAEKRLNIEDKLPVYEASLRRAMEYRRNRANESAAGD